MKTGEYGSVVTVICPKCKVRKISKTIEPYDVSSGIAEVQTVCAKCRKKYRKQISKKDRETKRAMGEYCKHECPRKGNFVQSKCVSSKCPLLHWAELVRTHVVGKMKGKRR